MVRYHPIRVGGMPETEPRGWRKEMDTTSREAWLQRQTLLQQRLDALHKRYQFLQEMFQSWRDIRQLPLPSEDRTMYLEYLQSESLRFRQALQHIRQDLRHERKSLRESMEPCSEEHR